MIVFDLGILFKSKFVNVNKLFLFYDRVGSFPDLALKIFTRLLVKVKLQDKGSMLPLRRTNLPP